MTDFAFDDLNRLTRVTDPNSNATSALYDAGSRLTRVTNALSQNVDAFYDSNGWITRVSAPRNRRLDLFYDKVGRTTQVKDALNNTVSLAYDKTHLLTQTTDPLTNTVKSYFDPVGNLTKLTNEKNNSWTVLYDAMNRATKVTHPDSNTETFGYDGNSNITSYTDGNAATTSYLYDSVDFLTKKDFPVGTTDVEYYFDKWGNRTKMVDAVGTTTYLYDSLDRLTQPTYPGSKVVSYFLDAVGNRTKMTDPDSGNTTYLVDNGNRLTSLTNPDTQTTTFLYDALDRVTKQTNHNGTYGTYAFNSAGNVTQIEHRKSDTTLLSSFSYEYNDVSDMTRVTETVSGSSATVDYAFDALYRLTKEKRSTTTPFWYEYLYDAAGNRTKYIQRDQMGGETSSKGYAYDAANKLTLEGNLSVPGQNGNIQYTWDANGNLTKKSIVGNGFTEYRYDVENHLTKLNDGVTLTFGYDGDGIRKSLVNGAITTKFIHDDDGLSLIAETDGSGTTTARYTHGDPFNLISQKRSTTTTYYHPEAIGSTRQLTNSSQVATDSYTFDAWGTLAASSGSTTNPYRFAGQWSYYDDGQSGLLMVGLRYYNPTVGRFQTSDPVQMDPNFYGYVENAPLFWVDPLGLGKRRGTKPRGIKSPPTQDLKSINGESIETLRKRAPGDAWKLERELVMERGYGTVNWTEAQKEELLTTGRVKGFYGHHINSVKSHPQLAGEPDNIKFVDGVRGNLAEHGGNFRNATKGELIPRSKMVKGLLVLGLLFSGYEAYANMDKPRLNRPRVTSGFDRLFNIVDDMWGDLVQGFMGGAKWPGMPEGEKPSAIPCTRKR